MWLSSYGEEETFGTESWCKDEASHPLQSKQIQDRTLRALDRNARLAGTDEAVGRSQRSAANKIQMKEDSNPRSPVINFSSVQCSEDVRPSHVVCGSLLPLRSVSFMAVIVTREEEEFLTFF